jgi:acetylornithine deacetylase/succinyl-diaminopimelate desuccinylase-like protein
MDTYRKLLDEAIKLRSISTDSQFAGDIAATAEWFKQIFEDKGFKAEVVTGYDNPIVVAHLEIDPSYKTCLVYGHYDVQPASQEEGWDSDPFIATERDGRIYARGAVDNKGQVLVHVAAIFDLIDSKELKYNIKFMIEGSEEIGSDMMQEFIEAKKDLLKADFALVSDGEIVGEHPTIELGFRGGLNSTLTVKTSSKDIHSGLFGGISPNALEELTNLLSKMYDSDRKITVKGFYDDVLPVTEDEIAAHSKIPFDMDQYLANSGTKAAIPEKGYDNYTSGSLRPSIQVTGVQGGYNGEGYRNSIPGSAVAKINFRLVDKQNPQKIAELFEQFIKENLPEYVEYEFKPEQLYEGIKLDINNEYIRKAEKVLQESFGADPYLKFVGGGLPIITYFNNYLGIPQVVTPLANEDCNMHGANENYNVEILEKALKFSRGFFSTN